MQQKTVKIDYPNPLVNKYLYDFSVVEGLFNYNPYDKNSFTRRYNVVIDKYNLDREELVSSLTSYNKLLGCGEATLNNLELLKNKDSVLVITGQQAGVLTGPLYTIHKTLSVIQLSRKLTSELGKPVLPMFWVAAEDHDFAEVDHVNIVTTEGLKKIRLEYKPEKKFSVGHIPVGNEVFSLIEELNRLTAPSEFKDNILDVLRQLAEKADNMADWFAMIMMWLFKDYGLIIVNPLDKEFRKPLSSIMVKFIEKTDEINRAFTSGETRVRNLGYSPQVIKEENSAHLFIYLDGERQPLFRRGDIFGLRGSRSEGFRIARELGDREFSWHVEDLMDIAAENPSLLSPNVVLRPVVQDFLLPVMAYVGGPGEIAYYAQFKDIYPLFGMEMPIIYPRANITLVEKTVARTMEKYGITFENVLSGLDDKLMSCLEAKDNIGIKGIFEEFRKEFEENYRDLTEKINSIDAKMGRLAEENKNKILHHLNHLQDKAWQQHRKNCDDAVRSIEKISLNLFPQNNYQERVFNIFPYLFKYSNNFLKELLGLPLLDNVGHKLIYI